ncbi:hypothetical protein D9758_001499 [Tetrapyrgos nigripes]|uniref:FAD-binding domain-containing protein n=1 Tax=Tetrapyrgos nigripes TaxID=182062 RepID=A0A8H5LWY5_9AGAR|nr:hypothetical protein D9758_001499 [Tetrapyrgos nigripes]
MGSAGLLIAHNLKKLKVGRKQLGIPYTIFEQDAALDSRPRDWSFAIYWAQTHLGECLPEGVDEKYLSEHAQVDTSPPTANSFIPIFNAETGGLLKKNPSPFSIRLQRRKFLRILSKDLDIRYGKRLAEIHTEEGNVRVTFADGTTEEGKLLIGCDGAHSRVRNFLFGPEKAALRPLPLFMSAALTTLPRETALAIREIHPRNMNSVHPNGCSAWIGTCQVQECSDPDPAKWVFVMVQTWAEDKTKSSSNGMATENKGDVARGMKERTKTFAEPLRSFWHSIPDDAQIWHNRLSDWPTEKWDDRNGTVILAGDAAHPMTFHRGQGLNNVINDVYTLRRALQEKYPPSDTSTTSPFAEALKVYEGEVWERGREAVLSNAENSLMFHDWDKLMQSPVFTVGYRKIGERCEK